MYKSLLKKFASVIEGELASQKWVTHIYIAVSGGSDSMLLAQIAADWKKDHGREIYLHFLHIDHGLRGAKASEAELGAILAIAVQNRVSLVTYRCKPGEIEEYASSLGGIESAARTLRHRIFLDLCSEGSLILTAHHADDRYETALMGFFEGRAGRMLNGLVSRNGNILRPFLLMDVPPSKDDLIEAGDEVGLVYVQDESNNSDAYLRNLLRNRVIPLVRDKLGNLNRRLDRLVEAFEDNTLHSGAAEAELSFAPIGSFKGEVVVVDCDYSVRTKPDLSFAQQLGTKIYNHFYPESSDSRIPRSFFGKIAKFIEVESYKFGKANKAAYTGSSRKLEGYGLQLCLHGKRLFISRSLAHSIKKGYFLVLVPGDYCEVGVFGTVELGIRFRRPSPGADKLTLFSACPGHNFTNSLKYRTKFDYLLQREAGRGSVVFPPELYDYFPRISAGNRFLGAILPDVASGQWEMIRLEGDGEPTLEIEIL